MKYCEKCGKEIADDAVICTNCGCPVGNNSAVGSNKKPVHTGSLVLMIIGALFCLLLPIVTYPCSIISLVLGIKKRQTNNTTFIIIIDIVAILIAIMNSIAGAIIMTR